MGLESIESKYLDGRAVLNCSDVTAAEIDNEVKRILEEAHKEAVRLLSDNREVLDKIADFLIERETITGAEFMKIFREIKGIPEPEADAKEGKEETQHSAVPGASAPEAAAGTEASLPAADSGNASAQDGPASGEAAPQTPSPEETE